MNIFDVIAPAILFLVGLRLLQELPMIKEDHLQLMNQKTADTL